MSDIIQRTKKALEGTTPGPWKISGEFDPEYPELHGAPQEKGSFVYTPILCENVLAHLLPRDVELITAAPELAQALAEETWEYAVQAKSGSKWEYKQDGFFRDAWFSELRKAKAGARELRSIGKETRIVRRRVSPPEVIDEEL